MAQSRNTFRVAYTPNTLGAERAADGRPAGEEARTAHVFAKGTKDALNQANNRTFGFAGVRFITHPSGRGLATVYDEDGAIIGQLTAKKA